MTKYDGIPAIAVYIRFVCVNFLSVLSTFLKKANLKRWKNFRLGRFVCHFRLQQRKLKKKVLSPEKKQMLTKNTHKKSINMLLYPYFYLRQPKMLEKKKTKNTKKKR